ncbi:LysR family transcriptional regulator [Nocardia aurantiaca]|uniref:LysR family transcriptional regulator n=1 Tax=Nocardia aurantiaca TaxID=2675850 RepID=A0A6I3L1T0_9NOCA|nr:LysR family transcriptional regulator [Nocardia aurantiaca]MTE15661.1 LysR family transcriptional regulator [Nocardia aurantiaca]
MELRHLRYFLAVARSGSLGQAAQGLHIAQSGLSQRIRALERDLGVKLFERSPRGVTLTAAADALVPEIQRLLDQADRVTALAGELSRGVGPGLRLGYSRSAVGGTGARLVRSYREQFPAVRVNTSVAHTSLNLVRLRRRLIDVGFVRLPIDHADDLEVLMLGHDNVVLAVPAGHRLAGVERVDRHSLIDEPLVYFDRAKSPGLWSEILRQVYPEGPPVPVAVEPEEAYMLATVALGTGVTLVLESVAEILEVPGVVLRRFEDPQPSVGLGIAWLRDYAHPTVRDFVEVASMLVAADG